MTLERGTDSVSLRVTCRIDEGLRLLVEIDNQTGKPVYLRNVYPASIARSERVAAGEMTRSVADVLWAGDDSVFIRQGGPTTTFPSCFAPLRVDVALSCAPPGRSSYEIILPVPLCEFAGKLGGRRPGSRKLWRSVSRARFSVPAWIGARGVEDASFLGGLITAAPESSEIVLKAELSLPEEVPLYAVYELEAESNEVARLWDLAPLPKRVVQASPDMPPIHPAIVALTDAPAVSLNPTFPPGFALPLSTGSAEREVLDPAAFKAYVAARETAAEHQTDLEWLLEHASNAGKLYAALLLASVGPEHAARAVAPRAVPRSERAQRPCRGQCGGRANEPGPGRSRAPHSRHARDREHGAAGPDAASELGGD